ncbi:hypothetical protein BC629DRAFT_1449231 [Irpex lacteus]|nr:hypothetical protein BC629DRAFT_1449231 [Irpex lacteus]
MASSSFFLFIYYSLLITTREKVSAPLCAEGSRWLSFWRIWSLPYVTQPSENESRATASYLRPQWQVAESHTQYHAQNRKAHLHTIWYIEVRICHIYLLYQLSA